MGVPAVLYIVLIGWLLYSLLKKKPIQASENSISGVSVVIPFRNEEDNLTSLLNTLTAQQVLFPLEIILVNDSSTDNYQSVIQPFLESNHITLLDSHFDSQIDLTSKQQALDLGCSKAQYEWLVFTDADMVFDELWLSNLTADATNNSPFIYGRTAIDSPRIFLERIQALQLDFLFATAWLFSQTGLDSSCMGNNICISKKLYQQIGGQAGIGYTIVEDKKLLSAIKKQGVVPRPSSLFVPDARTKPVKSINTYLHQMLRWLKGGSGESIQILVVILLLGLELLGIGLTIGGIVTGWAALLYVTGAVMTWCLFLLLFVRLNEPRRGIQFPLFLILLAIESLFVLPSLLFIKPQWKGRILKG